MEQARVSVILSSLGRKLAQREAEDHAEHKNTKRII